jgi:serine/threonine-protein kinase
MELVRGLPLHLHVKRRRFDESESVMFIEKVARAVGVAHARGIVHRDLKPANILVVPLAEPKVTDFGLARTGDAREGITESGAAIGTPMYMAPEQVSAKPTSPATDVYALGVILYEMLTGAPPHVGQTDMEIYRRTLLAPIAWPTLKNPNVGKPLEAVVLHALERAPEKRHRDATALADYLKNLLESAKKVGR